MRRPPCRNLGVLLEVMHLLCTDNARLFFMQIIRITPHPGYFESKLPEFPGAERNARIKSALPAFIAGRGIHPTGCSGRRDPQITARIIGETHGFAFRYSNIRRFESAVG